MRPRVSLGAALTLGAFICFAPGAFALLPLALLLAVSLPTRLGTVAWIAGCAFWSALWLAAPGPISEQVLKGWTVVTSGAFLLLALDGRRRPLDAAMIAAITASLATLVWLRLFRVDFGSVMSDALRLLWAGYRAMSDAFPALRGEATEISFTVTNLLFLFPGLTMLAGVAGCLLAWDFYHRLADRPVGDAPGFFGEFRFSDHFVWVLVLALAGTLAQIAGLLPGDVWWPMTLLVFVVGLYALRGAAVAVALMARGTRGGTLGTPLLLAAAVFALLLWFATVPVGFGIGMADTWLDFRRRPAAAPGE